MFISETVMFTLGVGVGFVLGDKDRRRGLASALAYYWKKLSGD